MSRTKGRGGGNRPMDPQKTVSVSFTDWLLSTGTSDIFKLSSLLLWFFYDFVLCCVVS